MANGSVVTNGSLTVPSATASDTFGAAPEERDAGRILLIDDDEGTRIAVGSALRCEGYLVEEAADGIVGIEAFRRAPPDVVLLDVLMPCVDGFETCRAIRALPEGRLAPIVMITGLDDLEWIDTAFEAGATTFFRKPLNFQMLGRRLRYIIRSKRVYDKLQASEAQLAHAQRLAKIGHWEWRRSSRTAQCSRSLCEILGLPQGAASLSFAAFLDLIEPMGRAGVAREIRRSIRQGQRLRLEHWIVSEGTGEKFIYQEAEIYRDGRGRITRIVGIAQDITERKLTEERIKFLAYYDPTTGLPNRSLLKNLLETALKRDGAPSGNPAVLFIDLDNFKKINDIFGHDVGDSLLRAAAERLFTSLRIGDAVSRHGTKFHVIDFSLPGRAAATRHGGDEFVVLLTDIRCADGAAAVARRIAGVLSESFSVGDREVPITASIGIAMYPQDGATGETLLKNAEAAMYDAKAQGRNCHRFFSHHLQHKLMRKISLEVDLREAIRHGELVLYYQPKLDLRGDRIVSAEALLRWEHASGTIISPAEFVPIAEETGLIVPIGEWVIREACAQAAAWQSAGLPPLKVAVNLSAGQFVQRSLKSRIAESLRDSGLAPNNLILELTESVLVDDMELSVDVLKAIKALGVGISIDDFGTGYSSLNYLKRLPLSELKIDRSFVGNVPQDPSDAAIINATVALAHNLDLITVAEGVENREQLDFLRSVGCDQAQGFLISRPLPAAAFEAWMRDAAGRTIAA